VAPENPFGDRFFRMWLRGVEQPYYIRNPVYTTTYLLRPTLMSVVTWVLRRI